MSVATAMPTRDELRTMPLSAINVREGFNPRERFDQRELDRLAASIASRGLLQPLIVTPGEQAGSYEFYLQEAVMRSRAGTGSVLPANCAVVTALGFG